MPKKRQRKVSICGAVTRIPLTQGREAIIDTADLHLVQLWNWCARVRKDRHPPNNAYAVRMEYAGTRPALVQMHSHILPPRAGLVIDHVNGDSLDNRRCNLRYATRSQNLANSLRVAVKTGVSLKGARQIRATGRWIAQITKDKQVHHLGTFDTAEEAHAAYAEAAVRLFREFARVR